MQLRIFTEPQQGADYGRLLAVARATEDLGFDAFFRSDHYLKMGDISGLPGPTDAWVTLAGLARETSRIRLGTLMSPATFRLPGPLAISVAQVDHMNWPSSPACGRPPRGRRSPSRGPTTRWWTRPRCPSLPSGRTRRS